MTNVLAAELDRILGSAKREVATKAAMPAEAPSITNITTYRSDELINISTTIYSRDSSYGYFSRSSRYLSEEDVLLGWLLPFDGTYHRHDSYELTYVVSGSFTYVMSGREIILCAGESILMDPNCVHFDRNRAADAVVIGIAFQPRYFEEALGQLGKKPAFGALLDSARDSVQRYLRYRPKEGFPAEALEEQLAALLRENNATVWRAREVAGIFALRFLLMLEDACSAELCKISTQLQKDLMLIEIDKYIQAHLNTVTIEDLVAAFHFNSSYFCRKIRQKYGITLTEYIQQRRLDRARQLLLASDRSISQIIDEVGYRNTNYFYKLFRQSTGMTPSEYKENFSTRFAGAAPLSV